MTSVVRMNMDSQWGQNPIPGKNNDTGDIQIKLSINEELRVKTHEYQITYFVLLLFAEVLFGQGHFREGLCHELVMKQNFPLSLPVLLLLLLLSPGLPLQVHIVLLLLVHLLFL